MNLKTLACASLLALGAAASHAEDLTSTVDLVPNEGTPGFFSAALGVTHAFAGAFTATRCCWPGWAWWAC